MRRTSVVVALLLLAIVAVPAAAAKPLDVVIESTATLDQSDVDLFTASGSAVDGGLICASGHSVDNLPVEFSGPPNGDFLILRLTKTFTCSDGTFDIFLRVKLDLTDGTTTANWRVVGGTGSYASLKGNGKLVGTPIVPGVSILDVYTGRLH